MKPKVTMRDVAKRARVSQRTVSNVVNNYTHVAPATRSRVEAAIADLGYRPNVAAQQLRAGKTGIIALAVPNMAWPYFGELAHEVQLFAQERGQTLLILETEGNREHELNVLQGVHSNLIDGLILSPIEVSKEDLSEIGARIPVVLIGEKIRAAGIPHFEIDGERAAHQVAQHLYDQGARSFVILGSSTTVMTSGPGSPRARGFTNFCVQNGISATTIDTIEISPWTYEGAFEVCSQWLSHHELPDAIFSMNDLMAVGALRALADIGASVPDDVLLTGWDGTNVTRFSLPSITTVSPDKKAIADHAVSALMHLISDPGMPGTDQFVPHELIIRESSVGLKRSSRVYSQ